MYVTVVQVCKLLYLTFLFWHYFIKLNSIYLIDSTKARMEKLKNASAAADKAKAGSEANMVALQTQINSQAERIQQLLECISDREDALELASRNAKKSMDDSTSKGRDAEVEIDTLKGDLNPCHSSCDALTVDLKVLNTSLHINRNYYAYYINFHFPFDFQIMWFMYLSISMNVWNNNEFSIQCMK